MREAGGHVGRPLGGFRQAQEGAKQGWALFLRAQEEFSPRGQADGAHAPDGPFIEHPRFPLTFVGGNLVIETYSITGWVAPLQLLLKATLYLK